MSEAIMTEVLRAVNGLRDEFVALRGEVVGVRAALTSHIGEETDELKDMKTASQDRGKVADDRHAEIVALIQSVNIVAALPKTKDGKPDIFGHCEEHEDGRDRRQTWRRRLDTVTTAILVSASLGALGWVGTIIWRAFLVGPVAK